MRIGFLLFLFLPVYVLSQPLSSDGTALSMSYMAGKIFMHTPKIHLKAPPYSSGVELSYKKQTTGTKDWQQRFGFPEVGVNLFLSMNGSKELGTALGIYPSIQFRLLTFKKAYWYFKLGGGIGLVSKHWERTPAADSMNNVIGSALNNFTMFQSGIRFTLNQHWTTNAGIHFYHLSNAAIRSPNFGINTFGIHVGVNYHPKGVVHVVEKKELIKRKNPLNLSGSVSIAFAEDKTADGPVYPIATGTLFGSKMYCNKSRIMVGMDAIYNTKSRAFIRNTYQMKDGKYLSSWQYTAFLGHEFLFGRIGFPVIAGAYLNRPVGGKKIYQKLGMNLHYFHRNDKIIKDAYISLLLKTHLVQAQYAELGFGFFL